MVVSGWGVFDGAWGWARPTFGGLAPGRVWPIVGFHPFFFPFYFIGFNFWDSDLAGFYAHRIFCHLFVYGRVT